MADKLLAIAMALILTALSLRRDVFSTVCHWKDLVYSLYSLRSNCQASWLAIGAPQNLSISLPPLTST